MGILFFLMLAVVTVAFAIFVGALLVSIIDDLRVQKYLWKTYLERKARE